MPQSSHVCVPQVVRGRSPSAAFGGVVVAVLQGVVAAAAEPIPGNDSPPHPPVILSRPDDVATLAAGFGLPAGFAAMLFAAEPDVANPVAIAVDRPGRCYVAETFSFGKQVATTSGVDPAAAVAADVSTVSIDDRLHWTERLLGEQACDDGHRQNRGGDQQGTCPGEAAPVIVSAEREVEDHHRQIGRRLGHVEAEELIVQGRE